MTTSEVNMPGDAADYVFRIRNLSVAYDNEIVLNVPKLDVPRGKLIFLLGNSGSGKTTFLETLGLMSMHAEPSSQIVFHASRGDGGYDYRHCWGNEEIIGDIRRSFFTFMFQETYLFPQFSVSDNVVLTQVIKNIPRENAERNARYKLGELDLDHRGDSHISQMSGGEKQRVAFARAVSAGGSVLFADEPTGNLGEDDAERVMQDIRQYIDSSDSLATAIVVSHNIDMALRYGDQIVVINDGHHILPSHILTCNRKAGEAWSGSDSQVDGKEGVKLLMSTTGGNSVSLHAPKLEVNGVHENHKAQDDVHFTRFYAPRSAVDLSPRKRINIVLIAILTIAFAAIGVSSGGLNVLQHKMQDPFVNLIPIEITITNSDRAGILREDFKDDRLRQKYAVRGIAAFHRYPLNVFDRNKEGTVASYGRSIDIADPILEEILAESNLVKGESFRGSNDIGLIVTEEFIQSIGPDRSSEFLELSISAGSQRRDVSVPIPIRAIVKNLPEQNQFLSTLFFYEKRNNDGSQPFNPMNTQSLIVYYDGPLKYVDSLRITLEEFLRADASFRALSPIVFVDSLSPEQAPSYSKYIVRANFLPDLEWEQVEVVYNRFKAQNGKVFETKLLYAYPIGEMGDNMIFQTDPFNRISVHMSNLEHIQALKDFLWIDYGLELDMAKIEALNNYRAVAGLTNTLSAIIIGISIISVCIFIGYILYTHLYKNRVYLGMLKAFGASSGSLKRVYIRRMLISLCYSLGIAVVVSSLLGYSAMIRLVLSFWFPVESSFMYFDLLNFYTPLFGIVLLVVSYWILSLTAGQILNRTPGDLVYDRLDSGQRIIPNTPKTGVRED